MDRIDRLAVKKMMYNYPCTEEEFYMMYKETNLFKRTRAWISLKDAFKRELDNSFIGKSTERFATWFNNKLMGEK